MRTPRPCQRKATGAWTVCLNGRQVHLGKDKKAAFAKYHRLMATAKAQSDYTVRKVVTEYWYWAKSTLPRPRGTVASRLESRSPTCQFLQLSRSTLLEDAAELQNISIAVSGASLDGVLDRGLCRSIERIGVQTEIPILEPSVDSIKIADSPE